MFTRTRVNVTFIRTLPGVLAREGSAVELVGPELTLGISRQNIGRGLRVGYVTNTWLCGEILPALRDRIEN